MIATLFFLDIDSTFRTFPKLYIIFTYITIKVVASDYFNINHHEFLIYNLSIILFCIYYIIISNYLNHNGLSNFDQDIFFNDHFYFLINL
jgi:hypothetical protein